MSPLLTWSRNIVQSNISCLAFMTGSFFFSLDSPLPILPPASRRTTGLVVGVTSQTALLLEDDRLPDPTISLLRLIPTYWPCSRSISTAFRVPGSAITWAPLATRSAWLLWAAGTPWRSEADGHPMPCLGEASPLRLWRRGRDSTWVGPWGSSQLSRSSLMVGQDHLQRA